MISWQSIMSVFNTKGTLLKWLKTLDQSLKDGVLQSVSVNPVSTGIITLTFNFADGSTITTPQIDIPQGAQGPEGPQGVPGVNGTNGESFNPMGEWVTDNEYHPFDYVTYMGSSYLCTETIINGTDAPPLDTAHWQLVAEKGDQGEPGPQGPKGDPGEAPAGTVTQSTVIERTESLPTATADSPDFVEVGGVLYRKKATKKAPAGGSLLGTWVFKDKLVNNIGKDGQEYYNITFLCPSAFSGDCDEMHVVFSRIEGVESVAYYDNDIAGSLESSKIVYSIEYENLWDKEGYKTIQITDISALTNKAEFTSWLKANATQTSVGGGTVTYSYVALADE